MEGEAKRHSVLMPSSLQSSFKYSRQTIMLSPPVSMTGRLKKELDAADCWIKLLQEHLKNRAQISLQENSQ